MPGAFDPISAALQLGSQLIDRLWPDKVAQEKERQAAQLALAQMAAAGDLAQLQVNAAEAANPSTFVAGWRPFIGWCCGLACAWNWLGIPLARLALELAGGPQLVLSPADLSEMWPVLIGMLGLGSLRTIEKVKAAA